jgi:hypothetical protein
MLMTIDAVDMIQFLPNVLFVGTRGVISARGLPLGNWQDSSILQGISALRVCISAGDLPVPGERPAWPDIKGDEGPEGSWEGAGGGRRAAISRRGPPDRKTPDRLAADGG